MCSVILNISLFFFSGQSFKFGSFGDGNGELNYPCYVAVNSQGHIIVSDMHSHRIQVSICLVYVPSVYSVSSLKIGVPVGGQSLRARHTKIIFD